MSVINRMKELISLINQHNIEYYEMDNPTIEDSEYDVLVHELRELEAKHPDLIQTNSPIGKVGGKANVNKFKSIKHTSPMLSLGNVFNFDQLKKWFDQTIDGTKSDIMFDLELKLDGLAVSLWYEYGRLVKGLTRGDGLVGEDITHNVKTIKNIPLVLDDSVLPIPDFLEVRGEVLISKEDFKILNQNQINKGLKVFANCRNAAAGSLRHIDSTICKERNLTFFAYTLNSATPPINSKTITDHSAIMKRYGFDVSEIKLRSSSLEEIQNTYNEILKKRDEIDIDIDGVVIKVDEVKFHPELGFTSREPKWAIAYKFPPLFSLTTIEKIEWQIGRSGVLTPVARIKPIQLGGVTVSNVTLHNLSEIKRLGVSEGSMVSVCRSGDVIPKILLNVSEKIDEDEIDKRKPTRCPFCNSLVVCNDTDTKLICTGGFKCHMQIITCILHFVSRGAMDIDGFGEWLITTLVEKGFIKTLSDIYRLKDHYQSLIEIPGLGETSLQKLLETIEVSKQVEFSNFIYALGIHGVGQSTAVVLQERFSTLDHLRKATIDDLKTVFTIGPNTSKSIFDFFNNDAKSKEIDQLLKLGIEIKYTVPIMHQQKDIGVWVFTGTLESMSRNKASDLIRNIGGVVDSNITSRTTHLVCGRDAGSKVEKAKKLGVQILDENDFIHFIEN